METFEDKNGVEIKDGDNIFHPLNNPKNNKIIEHEGELCFEEDLTPLSDKFQLNKYWEVKN